jgi:hypothetical protein
MMSNEKRTNYLGSPAALWVSQANVPDLQDLNPICYAIYRIFGP